MGLFSIILGFIIGAAILGGFLSGLIENKLGVENSGLCLIPLPLGFCLFGLGIGSIAGGIIGAVIFAILFKK